MSDYIHPLTTEAATQVASNLRPDDRREVEEGHGIPSALLPAARRRAAGLPHNFGSRTQMY